MRLAIVTHNVLKGDGQGRVNYEIARHTLDRGSQVYLLSDQIDPALVDMGATWIPVRPQARRINLLKVREFVWLADRALNRLGRHIDIIYGNGVVLSRPHHVNTAHFVHGAWLHSPAHTGRLRRDLYGYYQWIYTFLNARWEKPVFQLAKVVVAVSEKIKQELVTIGISEERIRVIHNGVDETEFKPGPADRQALGLPTGVTLALFVGNTRTPRKNLDTVLHALARIPEVHLAVVGDTTGSPYPALVAKLGLTHRVSFLGYRRDVPEIMRASDLFVFPSRYEAQPLVVLEALASGLPVITAATAGSCELVAPACGVVLPDPNDVDALAQALGSLASEPEGRRHMGLAARIVAERHTWSKMAQDYYRLFEELNR